MGGELTEQQQGISGLFSGGNGDGNMYNATGTIIYKITDESNVFLYKFTNYSSMLINQ